MDELEKSASAHCSHLSMTGRDWLLKMVDILLAQPELSTSFKDRMAIYKVHRVPEAMFYHYDTQAFMLAYERWKHHAEKP